MSGFHEFAELFVRARVKEGAPVPLICDCFGCGAEMDDATYCIEIILGEGKEFSDTKQPGRLCLDLCPRCAKAAIKCAIPGPSGEER